MYEAISRLGFSNMWPALLKLRSRGDSFFGLSLDLSENPGARLKVYVRHRNTSSKELDDRAALVNTINKGEWYSFCRSIIGKENPVFHWPVQSVYHLNSEHPNEFVRAVLDLPILPYIENDFVACNRISSFLKDCGLRHDIYTQCVYALESSPLELEQGIHSYISYYKEKDKPKVTVYFSSRIYFRRYGWLALDPKRHWPSPV
jgi:hypothetical protein